MRFVSWMLGGVVVLAAGVVRADPAGPAVQVVQADPDAPPPMRRVTTIDRATPVEKEPAREKEPPSELAGLGILGAELSQGGDHGAPGTTEGQGVQGGVRALLTSRNGRSQVDMLIGGRPSRGVMGELRLRTDPRVPLGEDTGFVGGLGGFDLTLMQTPTVWHSLFEFPRASLGYRHATPERGIELGAHVGWGLIGRYNPEAAHRALGNSLTPSLYLTAYTKHLFLALDARSFSPFGDQAHPVVVGEAQLCGAASSLSICLTGRGFRGHVNRDDTGDRYLSSSWQAGLMLGFGERFGPFHIK